MKDLEKRLSIIEEKLGINKVNLHVGLKFTTGKDGIVYEITSLSNNFLKVGWKGIEDRVDYSVSQVNTFFNNGDWKVYEPTDKFAELKEAHRNGEVIQFKPKCTMNYSCWVDEHNPKWNPKFEYRIKPEEKQKTKFHELAYELGITEDYKVDKFVEALTKLSFESGLTLEQDIQQLKDKYKQYKFTITIEDNI